MSSYLKASNGDWHCGFGDNFAEDSSGPAFFFGVDVEETAVEFADPHDILRELIAVAQYVLDFRLLDQ